MKKVLVVDDTKSILKMVKFVLGEKYDLYLSNSGQLALDILERKPIDIVLMDVDMPEMDGIETVHRIREMENIKDIPVMFFTAMATQETVEACMKAGMVDYIVKPYKPEELVERLESFFKRTTYVAPENGNGNIDNDAEEDQQTKAE